MLPTGRLVIRDLGDAQLHTEAVWALGGIGGAAPASLRNVNGLADPLLRYESTVLSGQGPYYPAETGPHSNHDAYPGRTQLHWHFYSSLGKGVSVLTASPVGTDPDARASGWQRVLQVNAIWGLAHNCAYVTKLESLLGLSFGIEWTTAPDPNTYTNLGDQDYHAAEARWRQDVNWERAQAAKIHAELCGGTARNALRAYRERRWAPGQSVEFQVNATTKWGQNILVVGGNTALGNWGPTSGIPMSAASYPVWTAKAQLPATSNVEYKYIRVDTDGSITWENGDNRVVGTGNGANPQQEHGNWR